MSEHVTAQGTLLTVLAEHEWDEAQCWYGVGETPVGPAVIVAHGHVVLGLWLSTHDPGVLLKMVQQKFGCQVTKRTDASAQTMLSGMFRESAAQYVVAVAGSDFDVLVWRALCQIPRGETRRYAELAAALGKPGAARAVGNALARNIVAYLIPCHRVLRQGGEVGEFRWGRQTKRDLLAWEQCK